MKYVFRLSFLAFIIVEMILRGDTQFLGIVAVLIIVASNIARVKYWDSLLLIAFEFAVTVAAVYWLSPFFIVLLGVNAYDVVFKKFYIGIAAVVIPGFYFLTPATLLPFLLLISICSSLSYVSLRLSEKENIFKNIYDKERRFRYELEQSKDKLLNSSREIAYLAEVKERNRIAREVHDNVGHSIAGVLMQLQASHKLSSRDRDKSDELLKKSIDNLSDSLTLLKNTVYNIKPTENIGIEYIKDIIESFSFCPVEFKYSGNFSLLQANQMEIICSNIKEALTNTSKYSKATKVDISLDANEKYVRLYIKDNGVGCSKITEGLGLSGMKERIKNVGGSISINGDDGFLIVCIIPQANVGTHHPFIKMS